VERFSQVESFDDVERLFLRGQGLSKNSYESYLTAVKGMYEHTDGLNPLQWTPADVESFYDALRERVGVNTAYVRMAGLKNFCKTVQAQLPFWESPFDVMGEKLKRKLSTSAAGEKKQPLYQAELDAVIAYLEDRSRYEAGELHRRNVKRSAKRKKATRIHDTERVNVKRLQDRAIVLTLVTTGLRAAELLSLTRDSLEHDTDLDAWFLSGIGKGNKPFTIEVDPAAVNAIFEAFRTQFRRDPRPSERLFWTVPNHPDAEPKPMSKATLWVRLRNIGDELKRSGHVRQSLEFSAHLFRRTFATLGVKNGMSVWELKEAGRWSSVETANKHYVSVERRTRQYTQRFVAASELAV
jgi:integrase